LIGVTLLQPFRHRFHQTPCAVDQLGSGRYQLRPGPDRRHVPLRLFPPVPDRRQQLRVYARQSRQLPGVDPIILPHTLRNQFHIFPRNLLSVEIQG
jgi:hypothetical protein